MVMGGAAATAAATVHLSFIFLLGVCAGWATCRVSGRRWGVRGFLTDSVVAGIATAVGVILMVNVSAFDFEYAVVFTFAIVVLGNLVRRRPNGRSSLPRPEHQ
jgi:cytochrome bd-type quinol oxidase subunit 1